MTRLFLEKFIEEAPKAVSDLEADFRFFISAGKFTNDVFTADIPGVDALRFSGDEHHLVE